MTRALLIIMIVATIFATDALARSRTPVRQFYKMMACPSTMKIAPPCPGYVVDHVVPLCAGGADAPSNMQWQEYQESLLKDKVEREMCRWVSRARK